MKEDLDELHQRLDAAEDQILSLKLLTGCLSFALAKTAPDIAEELIMRMSFESNRFQNENPELSGDINYLEHVWKNMRDIIDSSKRSS
ncbi:TPA: hypothetical protein SMF59_001639 [Serratia marcescens]|nr:hypothetical protein [Serratia marcescens]